MKRLQEDFKQMQKSVIKGQKRGIHFIVASVILWLGISVVRTLNLPVLTQNMLTFCMSAPLMPLAYLMSKMLHIKFSDKENPLSALGIILSLAQLPYLLIVMWIYGAIPDKMVMVYAMVFGAHLLPFGWYYKSKVYYVSSVLISITMLVLGCNYDSFVVAVAMVLVEIVFCVALALENHFGYMQDKCVDAMMDMEREEMHNGSGSCTQETARA